MAELLNIGKIVPYRTMLEVKTFRVFLFCHLRGFPQHLWRPSEAQAVLRRSKAISTISSNTEHETLAGRIDALSWQPAQQIQGAMYKPT